MINKSFFTINTDFLIGAIVKESVALILNFGAKKFSEFYGKNAHEFGVKIFSSKKLESFIRNILNN